MISALVTLIVLVIVIGIVLYLLNLLIEMLPMDGNFKQVAKVLIILVAVLIVLARALPLLGVNIG